MLRPQIGGCSLAEIVPLFSTSVSPPLDSMIALAEPLVPDAAASMAPLLCSVWSEAPASTRAADASAVAVTPVADSTGNVQSGGACPLPIRSAGAFASEEAALTVPATPIPPAIVTAPPRPRSALHRR